MVRAHLALPHSCGVLERAVGAHPGVAVLTAQSVSNATSKLVDSFCTSAAIESAAAVAHDAATAASLALSRDRTR